MIATLTQSSISGELSCYCTYRIMTCVWAGQGEGQQHFDFEMSLVDPTTTAQQKRRLGALIWLVSMQLNCYIEMA
jgi:hypothetical protein